MPTLGWGGRAGNVLVYQTQDARGAGSISLLIYGQTVGMKDDIVKSQDCKLVRTDEWSVHNLVSESAHPENLTRGTGINDPPVSRSLSPVRGRNFPDIIEPVMTTSQTSDWMKRNFCRRLQRMFFFA